MTEQATILIVDDDKDILVAGELLLKRHFSDVVTTSDAERIPDLMAVRQFDAILLDMNFSAGQTSGAEGLGWLERILRIAPDSVVILITAYSSVDAAVEAMKRGATDFVEKPWRNERLVATLHSAVQLSQSRKQVAGLKEQNRAITSVGAQQPILGQSTSIRAVLAMIERAGPTDANVLILGENGTGKELVARAIHDVSLRAEAPYLSVDVGALAEGLFESELFGHKKGAFTDARQDRAGRFEAADGGTIFLDEIGNIPLHLQAKLLTVLEQRRVTRVGANESTPFDVRVISATNLPKDQLEDEQRFRPDLLYRLNTVEIQVPPLRDRPDDVPELAQSFLERYSQKYSRQVKRVDGDALKFLQSSLWPGNVRALKHAIERAVILTDDETLTPEDFAFLAPHTGHNETNSIIDEAGEMTLEKMEYAAISAAMRRQKGNISKAARELGLTRASLYRRLEKHEL